LLQLLRWASTVFLLAGILAGGYAGYNYFLVRAYQSMETHKFEHRAPLAEPHLPVIGEAVGQIQIPRLKLKAIIVQGASEDVLRLGVGHLPDTAMPGEWGNVAIAGHRDRLFRPLREVRQGDIISIETSSGSFQYEVESTFVVAPADVDVLRSTDHHELTLITCFPFEYIGSAPNRFVVRAREVTQATK
jgi:sortase A